MGRKLTINAAQLQISAHADMVFIALPSFHY